MPPPSLKRRRSDLEASENNAPSGPSTAGPVSPLVAPASPYRLPSPKRQRPSFQSHASILHGASNVKIYGGTIQTDVNVYGEIRRRLYDEVARNAILNADGRVDIPRCYRETREKVLSQIENWMASGYRTDRDIFWLSGPAGAGKSAIMQTLAENCIRRKEPMANFFFFRTDRSRNHARPVVATLVCQLIDILPGMKDLVMDIIDRHPLIFETPLGEQFMTLVDEPIRQLRLAGPATPPIILLIDGLDECDCLPLLDPTAMAQQKALLRTLHQLITPSDSPFVAVVASRAESHIQMEFNSIGCADGSIFLDDGYHPGDDIRRYVTDELARIRNTHPLGQNLDGSWPPPSVINTVVNKSSGQFLYAATVCRFIENSPQSPSFSMNIVLSLRPPTKNYSPFTQVDLLYSFILSRAAYWDDASTIIALYGLHNSHDRTSCNAQQIQSDSPPMVLYPVDDAVSFFSDLGSLVKPAFGAFINLQFYHASFLDFLYSSERAGRYHIDLKDRAHLLAPRLILEHNAFSLAASVLNRVRKRNEALTDSLKKFAARSGVLPAVLFAPSPEAKRVFLLKIKDLYKEYDEALFLSVMRKVLALDPRIEESRAISEEERRDWEA